MARKEEDPMPRTGVCKVGGCTLCSYPDGFEKMCVGVLGGRERGGGRVACCAQERYCRLYRGASACLASALWFAVDDTSRHVCAGEAVDIGLWISGNSKPAARKHVRGGSRQLKP